MKTQHIFTSIDTHTGGNPTRTILSGMPELQGNTMADRMLDMEKNHDWIRKFLMNEPRGHDVMSGAIKMHPLNLEADVGVIFMETGGYLPMCGHDTIGFCTALVEAGHIPVTEPYTYLNLDTPAGLVKTTIKVENGIAREVTFANVPSFLLKSIEIDVDGIGSVPCDIAYGGNFYGIIDAHKLDLDLTPENGSDIIEKGITIRDAINSAFDVVHPAHPFISGLTHIEFFSEPVHPDADLKNTVIIPPGAIDRSPCGTGTSAKLATLYAQKRFQVGEPFVYESIVGTLFKSRILELTEVGGLDGVVPEVTGSAWVMGMHRFFYNEQDPLREGFLLIPPMD